MRTFISFFLALAFPLFSLAEVEKVTVTEVRLLPKGGETNTLPMIFILTCSDCSGHEVAENAVKRASERLAKGVSLPDRFPLRIGFTYTINGDTFTPTEKVHRVVVTVPPPMMPNPDPWPFRRPHWVSLTLIGVGAAGITTGFILGNESVKADNAAYMYDRGLGSKVGNQLRADALNYGTGAGWSHLVGWTFLFTGLALWPMLDDPPLIQVGILDTIGREGGGFTFTGKHNLF
ncbi:MAG: hypothetical protein KBD15_00490 [Candidatus Magasanikbacteria bacterium]|jgi:hypothetical protein|nr:hypothetical protein [Candidatus Magasanikbacteria bacterium]